MRKWTDWFVYAVGFAVALWFLHVSQHLWGVALAMMYSLGCWDALYGKKYRGQRMLEREWRRTWHGR